MALPNLKLVDKLVANTGATAPVPFFDRNSSAYKLYDSITDWSPWDTATLAGAIVPGVVAVRSRKRRKLLQLGGIGASQEELVDTGAEAAMVEFICQMWLPIHLQQYAALAQQIEMNAGTRGNPVAVQAVHPGLAMLSIYSLYITSIGIPQRTSPGGPYTAEIEAQEFKPIRKDKLGKKKNGKGVILPVNQAIVSGGVPMSPAIANINAGPPSGGGSASGVPPFLKP